MMTLICPCGHTAFRITETSVVCERCAQEFPIVLNQHLDEWGNITSVRFDLAAMHYNAAPIWQRAQENIAPVKPQE